MAHVEDIWSSGLCNKCGRAIHFGRCYVPRIIQDALASVALMEEEMTEATAEPKAIPGLTEGRIVHFVMGQGYRYPDAHRPAIVVRVWDKVAGTSNLQVFIDGGNDDPQYVGNSDNGTRWKTSVKYDPTGTEPYSWHFIEPA